MGMIRSWKEPTFKMRFSFKGSLSQMMQIQLCPTLNLSSEMFVLRTSGRLWDGPEKTRKDVNNSIVGKTRRRCLCFMLFWSDFQYNASVLFFLELFVCVFLYTVPTMTRDCGSESVYAKTIEYAHIQGPTGSRYPLAARHFLRYLTWPEILGNTPYFR